jgi:hypothetical protein
MLSIIPTDRLALTGLHQRAQALQSARVERKMVDTKQVSIWRGITRRRTDSYVCTAFERLYCLREKCEKPMRDYPAGSASLDLSFEGGCPNRREYSLLNCVELSYPTSKAVDVMSALPVMINERACRRRICF